MKYNRFFRILVITAIFSLLMVFIVAAPALAVSATLSPTKGVVGEEIDVTGSGYNAGSPVYIYFSSQEASTGDEINNEVTAYEKVKTTYAGMFGQPDEGDIDTYFYVPDMLNDGADEEVVGGGQYYVYTTYSDSDQIKTKDSFIVIGIELDTDEGPVDTEVEIEGAGFDGNEEIEIAYDGDDIPIVSGDDETQSDGDFTSTIIIPESTAGTHTITVEIHGDEGEAEFTVEPDMSIDPTSGTVDDEVTVNGTGFGDEVDVTITFDGDEVATDETDEYGSFEAVFNVPEEEPGTYDVEAEDDDNNTAEAEFTLAAVLNITPIYTETSPGYVGAEVTVSGTGFKAESQITITYTSTPAVFTTTSEEDGSFSYPFTIPPSEGGPHTITATDGTNTKQVAFYMESTAPATPQPLLPLLDGDLEDWTFDWEDVTKDASEADELSLPITYDFQIATDDQFTETSILREKTGLTDSEYILTEEEELESTDDEAPYYWRVRAIDAASNASGWTSAAAFHVGGFFLFQLEGWVLYTLIGVGAVIIFILGFWLGRRSIPEYY